MKGYRVFAARWDFQNAGQLLDDVELIRQRYALDPAEPIWVVDGGFTVGVRSPSAETSEGEDGPQAQWFGKRLVIFQMPPVTEATPEQLSRISGTPPVSEAGALAGTPAATDRQ